MQETPGQSEGSAGKRDWFGLPGIGSGIVLIIVTVVITKWTERKEVFDVEAVYGPYQTPEQPSEYKGFAQFTIANRGNSPAKQIQFQWQQEGHFELETMDKQHLSDDFINRFDLGDLAVNEYVTLSVWTKNRLPSEALPALAAESGIHHVIKSEPEWWERLIGFSFLAVFLITMWRIGKS